MHRSLLVIFCAATLYGQTQVDLRTQSKSVDFSGANATKPFKTGTVFPSTCAVGEMYYKVDAPAGSNLYACTSLNAWTIETGGSSGSGSPPVAGNSGKVLTTDGSSLLFGSLAGDISGPVSAVSVIQIQGRVVSSAAPASGQALAWNASTNRWEPQTVTGGGAGSGATMASQLGDFVVARTSASTLTIGANCTASTPCNVHFGNLVYSIVASATATITGGTGAALFYISPQGVLTAGHNLTVACSGCTASSGVTSFPPDSVPLFQWSATNGAWDATGGSDVRAFLGTKVIQPGAGIATTIDVGGITVLGADLTLIGLRTAVPPTAASACVSGSYAVDSSFYYSCVNTGTWRRVAMTAW
jgi:hypothetical protein